MSFASYFVRCNIKQIFYFSCFAFITASFQFVQQHRWTSNLSMTLIPVLFKLKDAVVFILWSQAKELKQVVAPTVSKALQMLLNEGLDLLFQKQLWLHSGMQHSWHWDIHPHPSPLPVTLPMVCFAVCEWVLVVFITSLACETPANRFKVRPVD